MYAHSDPTAARAIGAASRDWHRMARLAYWLRTDPMADMPIETVRRLFRGIFSRLLTDPLEEVAKQAKIK